MACSCAHATLLHISKLWYKSRVYTVQTLQCMWYCTAYQPWPALTDRTNLVQIDKDHDPMAQYKKPTIADKEDDYRARRRAQVLSPDRIDPFMDGTFTVHPPPPPPSSYVPPLIRSWPEQYKTFE